MKKILAIITFLCLTFLTGCFFRHNEADQPGKKDAWAGKTGNVTSAPEVDDDGNPINSSVIVRKPEVDTPSFSPIERAGLPIDATAKECLENWLNSFKNSDWEQVALLSYQIPGIEGRNSKKGASSYLYSKIEWEINQISDSEEKATFSATISVPDITESLKDYIESKELTADNIKAQLIINKDVKKLVNNSTEQRISELEIVTMKEDGIWKVCLTDELIHAMTGGLSNLYRELLNDYLNEVIE